MEVSEKLSREILTIVLSHWLAIVFLFSLTVYIYLRAQPSMLLKRYLALVAMIFIWLISKILKSVSPNVVLRWFFIVTQYFGVQFLGYTFLVFAMVYIWGKLPKKWIRTLLLMPPMVSFLVVATNPLHMKFYKSFDFYKDSFGVLFLPIQLSLYAYLIAGVIMLAMHYNKQPHFKSRPYLGRFFACVTLIPLGVNVFYVCYKLTDMPWPFSFPVFDLTPIAITAALLLFILPAFNYKFLNLSPVSFQKLFESLEKPVFFCDAGGEIYGGNGAFHEAFKKTNQLSQLEMQEEYDFKYLFLKNGHKVCQLTDVSKIRALEASLNEKKEALNASQLRLEAMAKQSKALARLKAQNTAAQNLHDILGHSLTVVIGNLDLMALDNVYRKNLKDVREMLLTCIVDLRNTLVEGFYDAPQTDLIKRIKSLENPAIAFDFSTQGDVLKLPNQLDESIFRTCQEGMTNAIRHGKAQNIHVVLRYLGGEIEIFIIDDGIGCKEVIPNVGIMGMKDRITALGGVVTFRSNGERGFHIHARIPIK